MNRQIKLSYYTALTFSTSKPDTQVEYETIDVQCLATYFTDEELELRPALDLAKVYIHDHNETPGLPVNSIRTLISAWDV